MASRPAERVVLATDPGVGVGRVPVLLSELHVRGGLTAQPPRPAAVRPLHTRALYLCLVRAYAN